MAKTSCLLLADLIQPRSCLWLTLSHSLVLRREEKGEDKRDMCFSLPVDFAPLTRLPTEYAEILGCFRAQGLGLLLCPTSPCSQPPTPPHHHQPLPLKY